MDDIIIEMAAKIRREEENQRREELNMVQRMLAMQNPKIAQMPLFSPSSQAGRNEIAGVSQKLGLREGVNVAGKCFCPAKSPVGRPKGSYGYRTPSRIDETRLANKIKKEIILDVKNSEKKKVEVQNSTQN